MLRKLPAQEADCARRQVLSTNDSRQGPSACLKSADRESARGDEDEFHLHLSLVGCVDSLSCAGNTHKKE